MKTLLILRHAKSAWDQPNLDDHDRPLNARGHRDAPRMGRLLAEVDLVPDVILTSTAERAKTTAVIAAQSSGYIGTPITKPELYLASVSDILAVLASVADDYDTVMIVAHNPGLADLVAHLTNKPESMPTAALAQVRLPIARWQDLEHSTEGTLVNLWRPKGLT